MFKTNNILGILTNLYKNTYLFMQIAIMGPLYSLLVPLSLYICGHFQPKIWIPDIIYLLEGLVVTRSVSLFSDHCLKEAQAQSQQRSKIRCM